MLKFQRILTLFLYTTFSGTLFVPFRNYLDTRLLTPIPVNHLGQLVWAILYIRWNTVSSALLHSLHTGETFAFSILAFITVFLRDWSCPFFSAPQLNDLKNRPWSGLFLQYWYLSSFLSLIGPTSFALFTCTFAQLKQSSPQSPDMTMQPPVLDVDTVCHTQ